MIFPEGRGSERRGGPTRILSLVVLAALSLCAAFLLGDAERSALAAVASAVTHGGTGDGAGHRAVGRDPLREPSARESARSDAASSAQTPAEDATTAGTPLRVSPLLLHQLVADLHDDDVRGNADRALVSLANIGAPAIPALRAALASADDQQRYLAAIVLMRMRATPDRLLLTTALELLVPGKLPWPRGWMPSLPVSQTCAEYLSRGCEPVWPELRAWLWDDDPCRRFAAAFLLGWSACPYDVDRTCAVLIPRLRDNRVPQDAVMASAALHRAGGLAVPHLLWALGDADAQATQLIELLLEDHHWPIRGEEDLRTRAKKQDISRVYSYPAAEFRFTSFDLAPGFNFRTGARRARADRR